LFLLRRALGVRWCPCACLRQAARPDGDPNMQTLTEAERVTRKTDTQDGQRIIGYWLDLTEAAELLGVSDRTLRRRIKADKVVSRLHKGRRQVRVDTTDTTGATHGQGADIRDTDPGDEVSRVRVDKVSESVEGTLARIDTIERDLAGVLATFADTMREDRLAVVERAEAELERVRRRSVVGWSLAFVAGLLAATGGVLAFSTAREAQRQAAALEGVQAQLEAVSGDRDAALAEVSEITDAMHQAELRAIEAEAQASQAELVNMAPGIIKP